MNQDEIFQEVKEIIVNQLQIDESEIKLDTNFQNDLGADSLDLVELIMALEEKFDMKISDEEAESIITVDGAVDYIKSHKES